MWLLEQKTRELIEACKGLTAEQQMQSIAFNRDQFGKLQAGPAGIAAIPIEGILTQQRDFMAMFFGGGNTLYPDIIGAIAEANDNESVTGINLAVGNSPGGNMTGLWQAMEAVRTSAKPITMTVAHEVASATYMLGSQATEIVALNKAVRAGSLGVLQKVQVDDTVLNITNRESPDKAPNVATDEGVATVQDDMDNVFALYGGAVAKGRGKTMAVVNKTFGRGSMLMASDALAVGMIDRIESAPRVKNKPTATGGKQEAKSMDITTLKHDHPEVYAAAVAEGVRAERDRCNEHLIMGEASGDMATALKAVKDGDEMTGVYRATYNAAHMKRSDIEARGDDNPDAETVAPAAKPPVVAKDDGEISDELADYMLSRNAEMEV